MPQMGFDMTEGTIAAWLKKEGEMVTKGEPLAEIETDKTTIQIEAFASGVLAKIVVHAGQKTPVGEVIGIIAAPGESVATAAPAAPAAAPAAVEKAAPAPAAQPVAAAAVNTGRIMATPVAKRIAEERGIDLRNIVGTGPEGRITRSDVEAAPATGKVAPVVVAPVAAPVVAAPVAAPVVAAPVAAPVVAAPVAAPVQSSGRKPLTRMRQTIVQRMTQVKGPVRAQINESLKADGVKVSVNDMVVKAVATSLRRFPNFNAAFGGDAIELREQINIGIAVAMDGGLIVITLKDADKKTLRQIGAEVPAVAARVREGKGQPGDMGGQTFTTSNLGMYGVDEVIPIINMPDSGILGIGGASAQAVVRDGQIVIRTMMKLTLAGDHRVTDGAEGAQFLGEIKRLLENPWGLVL
ncbi:MAG: dihydrolipoamide acetyltransferase family protein [Chloroflexi bacterium]|nr:dihydrolipoamide acetyltransferase family protein [Chloroflexota bacterium]